MSKIPEAKDVADPVVFPNPKGADITTKEGRAKLIEYYDRNLVDNVMRFWLKYGPDREHGGFFSAIGRDGELLDDDKSVWFQGRAGWMFATLYNTVEARPEWLAVAQSCAKFLDEHCCDASDGGHMYFSVTRDGKPLRKRRYAFSESFAAITHAALYGATKDAYHAQKAKEYFDLYMKWTFEPGVAPPKFTDVRPLIGMSPRIITIATAQELRTYLPAEDAPALTARIDHAIDEIRRLFVKPELKAVMECVTPDGAISNHFDGRLLNPGHAIEGAWFIMLEGKLRGSSGEGKGLVELGATMLDWMFERGWDKEMGGILYFRDVYGKPVQEYWQDMKFWWPHNEVTIATTLAYMLTGDKKYAEWQAMCHNYCDEHFMDKKYGDAFGYLHRDGSVSVDLKGNMWKGPFHYPRMLWVCSRFLKEMQK